MGHSVLQLKLQLVSNIQQFEYNKLFLTAINHDTPAKVTSDYKKVINRHDEILKFFNRKPPLLSEWRLTLTQYILFLVTFRAGFVVKTNKGEERSDEFNLEESVRRKTR